MRIPVFVAAVSLPAFAVQQQATADAWNHVRIHETFFAEGASAGDIDGDGIVDLVAGPFWYRGPDFEDAFPIGEPREFNISRYSDQFFSEVLDANNDGANDVLVLGFPGQAARLYLNPGADGRNKVWPTRIVADIVDNESPHIIDLVPGGLPEIVCGREGRYGYYEAGADATEKWLWNPVTAAGTCPGRFAHGMGIGDVNSDGHPDLLDRRFWWQNPGPQKNGDWQQHQWAIENYGGGGAQIHVDDVDGDGDSDIITSLNAHGYGLAWFEQTESGRFRQHDIMGASSTENDFGVAFSQLHALDLVDLDGDGRKDIVTGKRWMAHQGKDVGGLQEAVLYSFRHTLTKAGDVQYVPHLIHRDSGVGVDVLVTDLNADDKADIVSCSKRGLSIHFQTGEIHDRPPETWKVHAGTDQSEYADGLEPEQAAARMMVPDGFSVDLIASEPRLTQPIAMCFDARGRLWVVEGHTYPTKAPEGQGRDRVIILEDADANGSFEKKTTFIEGLNLASAIEVGFGGVWIGAAPHLLFIPDADHDGVPDGEPQVLLDGWGYQDTHETLNSFTWGPDGWLYGCHGVFTHSKVGKPGTPDDQRVPLNAGVWRYHPVRHKFEVYAHGTSNPWGVDFNDRGEWFISACVIPHLFHIQKHARYQRQGGQHFNPHTYDDIKTIADHAHFAGNIRDHAFWGDNSKSRPAAPMETSLLGGGHAHCGLAIYNGDTFPSRYRGDLFFHNLHGHRIVRETVERDGSGFVGRHRPDFAKAQDHQQIGVGIMVGPDGALYTSDWHDLQTCHNRADEVWNRTDGRLFRIRYGKVRPQQLNLWKEPDHRLVQRLTEANGFLARQARRILHERSATSRLQRETVAQLQAVVQTAGEQKHRLKALWTLGSMGRLNQSALHKQLLHDRDNYVRAWSVHFWCETASNNPDTTSWQPLQTLATQEPSRIVRRFLASALQDMPPDARWPVLEALSRAPFDLLDRNLPLLVWYGLEPLAAQQPSRAFDLAAASHFPDLLKFTVRRTTATQAGRSALVDRLLQPKHRGHRLLILEELNEAAIRRGGLTMPARWPLAYAELSKAPVPQVQNLSRSLAVRFGDASVLPFFRDLLTDPKKSVRDRRQALAVLRKAKDPKLPAAISDLLSQDSLPSDQLLTDFIAALADFDRPQTTDQLLTILPRLSVNAKTAALNTLVARRDSAEQLVEAMESGSIPPTDVPAFIVRQAIVVGGDALQQRLEKTWGRISLSSEENAAQYEKYEKLLTRPALAAANPRKGRILYEKNCGRCHRLFGTGGDIGPNITGANRTSIRYWLENILEPSALIGKAYQVHSIVTEDGRVLNGIVQAQNEDAITLQTATEQVVVARDTIEEQIASPVSLMPEGQLNPMSPQQVLDLFAYLTSPTQVSPAIEIERRPGTVIIEAEKLKPVVSAGTARPQNMSGFGTDWSGNEQLWWTGGTVDSTLELTLPAQQGVFDAAVYLTKANDYAQVEIRVGEADVEQMDLFAEQVRLAAPVVRRGLKLNSGQPLTVTLRITGANDRARPSLMAGIDRIELIPAADSPDVPQKPASEFVPKKQSAAERSEATSRAATQPNFIVVFCDDMGYGDIGPFGATGYDTPNLHAMAKAGMVLTDFHVAQSFCSPSRAALLTGRYPYEVGVPGNFMPRSRNGMNTQVTTLPQLLKSAGYDTACFGKWHLGHQPPYLPTSRGFDQFFGLPYSNDMWPHHPENGSRFHFPHLPLLEDDQVVVAAVTPRRQQELTKELTNRAVRFIQQHGEGPQAVSKRPFFLYVPFPMPHVPLFASEEFEGRTARGLFGDVIAEIDWGVGQILQALEACKLKHRTLVLFTSDNGPWLTYGDHAGSAGPLRAGKGSIYEGGFRVPCVVQWPGTIPGDQQCDALTTTLDLLPTFAAMAGIATEAVPGLDGQDITALLQGQPQEPAHEVRTFIYFRGRKPAAVRQGQWKLILPHTFRPSIPGRDGRPGGFAAARNLPLALYDLTTDIAESRNLAQRYPDKVAALTKLALDQH